MTTRIPAALIGSALAAAPFVSPAFADSVPLRDSVPHITTNGEASAAVVPDQADIRLGIRVEKPTAEAATAATAKQAAAAVAAIKGRGIDPKDIKTSLDVSAQYDSETDPKTNSTRRVFRGYAAAETLTVRIRDLATAGSLARELIDKGANSFEGIDYSYSKEKDLRRRLSGEAIRDALASARSYTDAIDVHLGRVLQIGEAENGGGGIRPHRLMKRAEPAADDEHEAIPTEPGVQTVTESISVVWEIEGKAR